jgi:hypothetical protein
MIADEGGAVALQTVGARPPARGKSGRPHVPSKLSFTTLLLLATHAHSTAWIVSSHVLFVQRLEAASKATAVDMQLKAEFGVQLQLRNEIEVERSQHHAAVTSLRDELQRVRTFYRALGLSLAAAPLPQRWMIAQRSTKQEIMSDRTGKVSVSGSGGAGSAV